MRGALWAGTWHEQKHTGWGNLAFSWGWESGLSWNVSFWQVVHQSQWFSSAHEIRFSGVECSPPSDAFIHEVDIWTFGTLWKMVWIFPLLSVVNPGVPQKTEPVKKIVCSVFEERRSEGNENKAERRKPTTTWYSGIMVTEDHVYMFWEICAQLNRKGEVIC